MAYHPKNRIYATKEYEWYRYSGAVIETSRPFCRACSKRKWFHISEIPKILNGDFPEFIYYKGKVNKKTGKPRSLIPNTTIENFVDTNGGYQCMHRWMPGDGDLVPEEIKQNVYQTDEYKTWKANDN